MELKKLGLTVMENFISLEEESLLMFKMVIGPVKKTKTRNSVRRFGSELPYKPDLVSKDIPEHFDFLTSRLVEQQLLSEKPNSVSVNEYFTGQEIMPHIDSKTSGSVITILSLLSDATMVFQKDEIKHDFFFPARALIQLRGEIRNLWKHSISPVKQTRYSIVFRYGIN